jgi:hypothetical protein
MFGLGSLLGFTGGIVKDVIAFIIESKKETKQLQIQQQSQEKQKEIELQIFDKQIALQNAGIDIETQKKIIAEYQSQAEIIKSNNSLESNILDIRKAEINSPSLEYLRDKDGNLGMWGFVLGFCNILICLVNCFKAAPLMLIICLIGFLIFILSIKSGISAFSQNDFCMGLLTLLEVMTSYFTGRKISVSFTENQKKKS